MPRRCFFPHRSLWHCLLPSHLLLGPVAHRVAAPGTAPGLAVAAVLAPRPVVELAVTAAIVSSSIIRYLWLF